jgi:hypothetical protein
VREAQNDDKVNPLATAEARVREAQNDKDINRL